MNYELSESLLRHCYLFADQHAKSSRDLYSQRNQNTSNLTEKIYKSKIAEWVVYKHLRACGYSCTYPDHKIYDSKDKSYDADLYCHTKNTHIHVKSISKESADRYGLSWILESNDPIINKPQANHWFALVQIDDVNSIRIIGWLNSTVAQYKPTKLNHPTKLAIYYQDIKHLL